MIIHSYSIQVSGIKFELEFKNNLTLIDGESGLGKTMLYKQIKNDALVNSKKNIVCLDYNDANSGNVSFVLNNTKGKLIIIDNAEVVLSDEQRLKISIDKNNQYVIFTHTTRGFKPSKLSFTTLKIKGNQGYLEYDLI